MERLDAGMLESLVTIHLTCYKRFVTIINVDYESSPVY